MTHKVITPPVCENRFIGLVDPQGRKTKQCKIIQVCPTLRAQIHGNPPCAVYEVKQNERDNQNQASDKAGLH